MGASPQPARDSAGVTPQQVDEPIRSIALEELLVEMRRTQVLIRCLEEAERRLEVFRESRVPPQSAAVIAPLGELSGLVTAASSVASVSWRQGSPGGWGSGVG